MQMKVGKVKAVYDEAKAELDDIEKQLSSCNSELKSLTKEKSRLTKKAESAEFEGKKLSVKVAKHHKEKANAERFISSMLKKYPWIESEKDAFGIPGGDYDFDATNPSEMSSYLKSLKNEQEILVSFTSLTIGSITIYQLEFLLDKGTFSINLIGKLTDSLLIIFTALRSWVYR